jgi:hypothetical protein
MNLVLKATNLPTELIANMTMVIYVENYPTQFELRLTSSWRTEIEPEDCAQIRPVVIFAGDN